MLEPYNLLVAPVDGLTSLGETRKEWDLGYNFIVTQSAGCWRRGQRLTKPELENTAKYLNDRDYHINFEFKVSRAVLDHHGLVMDTITDVEVDGNHLLALQAMYPQAHPSKAALKATKKLQKRLKREAKATAKLAKLLAKRHKRYAKEDAAAKKHHAKVSAKLKRERAKREAKLAREAA